MRALTVIPAQAGSLCDPSKLHALPQCMQNLDSRLRGNDVYGLT